MTAVRTPTLPPTPDVAPAPHRGSGLAWWSGIVAGLVGLSVTELLAWLVSPLGSPLSAVGELVIDIAPAGVINFGKEVLGFADKPILLAVVGVVALLVAGASGRLEYARRSAGLIGPVLLTAFSVIAIGRQPDVTGTAYVPVVIGLAVAYLVLRPLVNRLRLWDSPAGLDDSGRPVGRRGFLVLTGTLAAGAVVVGAASRGFSHGKSMALQARSKIKLPIPQRTAPAVPAGADLQVPGITPYVTANDGFYRIDTALQVPVVDPADWSLTITGMVDRPITISWDQLLSLPLSEFYVTLTCVSNEVGGNLAGNARWLGYPIRELLERAGVKAGADMVLSRSVDGFTAGSPLSALTDPDRDAIVAIGMNGQPLPAEHGFPARLVVPGLYGYVSATKWVTELKVTSYAADHGYWTPLGWSAYGPIKLASRIDTPTGSTQAGPVAVGGVAWAQHTGVERVELRIDDGPWQRAKLGDAVSDDTWRQWSYRWDADPGAHRLTVRATDKKGMTQTAATAAPAPDGATGWHTVNVQVH
ncbi:molybdopterin-dependent oxidoreductase [Microlunatus soli]|uniref:DMSO/TMAO reductase YedYZ, molybdopterin-dependent catalytic subunit n=1 Tax=Microlunatus soli TaxID=630515 RepID=A0A1H1V1T8_9ACTN|nr:molybdopterin-dependent oxidoreductase [Microlunatus soli]SDS78169.1 DMSO/TMAO reductase YedYZ, molybdopterin-dependent catalytic subunit [Microlunatus soli]